MSTKKRNNNIFVTTGIVLVLIAVCLMIAFLTRGSINITNNPVEVNSIESVVCTGKVGYPLFNDDGIAKKTIQINAVFKNDKLDSIALVYKAYSNSASEIEKITTSNNATMNKSFSTSGLGANSLGAGYSRLKDASQMSLYAKHNEINVITAKYFLLDELNGRFSRESITKAYNEKGLDCKINN